MSDFLPNTAMIFAAGFGKRMLPITKNIPKALVQVNGKTLLDYSIDIFEKAAVKNIVVNTHYMAEKVIQHIKSRTNNGLDINVSCETPVILETGGGIVQAIPLIGDNPFYVKNADVIMLDKTGASCVLELARMWDSKKMDALLSLVKIEKAIGYDGRGDFNLLPSQIVNHQANKEHEFVYAGVMIIKPDLFQDKKAEPFSIFKDFIFQDKKHCYANGDMPRIYGLEFKGTWLHVGTPESMCVAEEMTKNRF